jgi:hypothetical protein
MAACDEESEDHARHHELHDVEEDHAHHASTRGAQRGAHCNLTVRVATINPTTP